MFLKNKKYVVMAFLFVMLMLMGWVLLKGIYDNNNPEIIPETPKSSEDYDAPVTDLTDLSPLDKFLSKEEIEKLNNEFEIFAVRDDSYMCKENQEYFIADGICFYIWGDSNTYKMNYNVRNKEFSYSIQETTDEEIQKEREESFVSFHRYPSEFDYRSLYALEVPDEVTEIFKSTEITFICFLADYLGEHGQAAGIEIRECEVNPGDKYILGFNMDLIDVAGNKTALTTVFNRGIYEFRDPNTEFPLYTSNSEVTRGTEWEKIGEANDLLVE